MGGASLTALPPGLAPAARAVVEEYLTQFAEALPGSRRVRAAIAAEITDGLLAEVEEHQNRGAPPARAAELAVADFGEPRELAAGFALELAGATAHRVGLALVSTGPVVGLTWVAVFASDSGLGWRDELSAIWSAIPAFALVLLLVVPAAVLATAGAGRAARRVPVSPRLAAAAASFAGAGCVVGDVTLIVGLVAATARGAAPSWLAAVAVGASVLRLTLAGAAARRCALLRAAAG
jgi:hypothetical protein